VILIERSEINSESRRTPAVSIARTAATLNTRPRFVAVVAPRAPHAAMSRVMARAILPPADHDGITLRVSTPVPGIS